MKTWQLQQARANFSELFDRALADGPQRVTRHGKAAVLVVSEAEWEARGGSSQDFGALLAACPLSAEDLPARRPARAVRTGGTG